MLERVQHRVAGGASQTAVGSGLQHVVQMLHFGKIVARTVPGGDLVHGLFQHRGTDATRRAEAAALMREEVHKIACHLEHVATVVEHHERTGSGQILEAQLAVEFTLAQHTRRKAR